jgi:HAE1 family hydrophobic/amphiphilic exporter-1
VGRLEGKLEERSIRLRGRLASPEEFAQLVVSERNGRLVRLGDVAQVKDGAEEQRTLALYNGKEAVGIDLKKAKGYSTTDVSERVLSRIEDVRKRLPANVKLDVVRNAGARVDASVGNVEEALLLGALLTVLVVFLFLNSWRSTVITGLALPVSVLASFMAVASFGFTLNMMSLLGLSLAIGILIDDAIVVRENIVRHVEMGKDHFTAAHDGTDEIGLAVAATTFSILAVFIPVAFLTGESGQWFKPFALTIASSVSVSLMVSFSLDPMLSAYWPDPHLPPEQRSWITRMLDRFNAWFNRRAVGYKRIIAWALDHRWSVVAISLATFFFALAMPALHLVGVGFVPETDNSEIIVALETPPGSNLEYMHRRTDEVLAVLKAQPEVRYTYTTLGGGFTGAVDEGTIMAKLTPKVSRKRSVQEIARAIRPVLARIGGVKLAVRDSDWGGNQKLLMLDIRGADVTALNRTAEQIAAEVEKVAGAVDVGLSTKGLRPEITVDIDRGLAGSLGITVGQVATSLRPAFAGLDAGDWIDPGGETRKVMIRLSPEARTNVTDLRQLPLVVTGPNGTSTIPLNQVAKIEQDIGPAVINHLDRDPVVTVGWNMAGRSSGEIMADVHARLATIQLPDGVTVTEGGQAEQQTEVFSRIFQALGVAVLLMYLVLAMQFGSFLDPLAIMMSLPLSLIGVMLALSVSGNTINIMSLMGVILLMGIVAKNAILLIDFAKWSHEKDGVPLREALINAGAIRLRPILMTTFALIAGMMPIALGRGEGAQFRAPLGVAVIGGVITSTFLTLLAIPTFYEILVEGGAWIASRVRRLFGKKTVPHTDRLPA